MRMDMCVGVCADVSMQILTARRAEQSRVQWSDLLRSATARYIEAPMLMADRSYEEALQEVRGIDAAAYSVDPDRIGSSRLYTDFFGPSDHDYWRATMF